MADYGIQPTGFVRKPLPTILAEIEASLITEFGSGVIQTSQSPLGQINGLMADYVAQLWEFAEDVYQSYDPDQAEGTRLDILGRLRLLNRASGELDEQYRQAITNANRARVDIQDIARAIQGIEGVTYTQVFVDDPEVPIGHIAVAVLGGDDDAIAEVMRRYIVPGISTFGPNAINSNIDGFCRSMNIIRPILVPVTLQINVSVKKDKSGCPPPSTTAIRQALVANIDLINGQDVTLHDLRLAIECVFSNVEIISFVGERDGISAELNNPVIIGFIEMATVAFEDVTVTVI